MPWKIMPVHLEEHALNHARFDHAAHATSDCSSCHAAGQSKLSADLLLPELASCRECHGDVGSANQVPSTCTLCHGFHIAEKYSFGDGKGKQP